jgi:DNA-binding NarL/FixJ family response regulator
MTVRVLIADDHAIVRRGTRDMLESHPDVTVVAEAADGESAVEMAEVHTPDVVVIDVEMPGIDGLEATRRIVAGRTGARVVVLSVHAEDVYVQEAIRAGARGYLLKHVKEEELVASVLRVGRGEAVLDGSLTAGLLAAFVQEADGTPRPTPRQLEVLALAAEGASNKEIAISLGISERTVEVHLTNLFKLLGVASRTEAVTAAVRRGLIDLGPAL